MKKEQSSDHFDDIEDLIAAHSGGIGRKDLENALAQLTGRPVAWRTLLRRLNELMAANRVTLIGGGRNRLYQAGPEAKLAKPVVLDNGVTVSRAGLRIRELIRRPKAARTPVGYNVDFLEAYVPGTTWYLPSSLRQHLHALGATQDDDRPAGSFARDIYERLLIDLAWASSRLEGNTYDRLDTQNLLEFGQQAEGKDLKEARMILNHKAAIALLVDEAERIGFNRYTFFNLHVALSHSLLRNPADEGRLRSRAVSIGGSVYMSLAIPQLIEALFDQILAKAAAIPDPFEQTFFIMVHIPYLQPFMDVNKRTSRLGANISLIKANLCPMSFVDMPVDAYVEGTLGVYELTRLDLLRDVFAWGYERSCRQYKIVRETLGDPDLIRLRYTVPIRHAVQETVRDGIPPRRETLRAWAQAHHIPEQDVDAFVQRALSALLGLHEGQLYNYQLTPQEFTNWRSRFHAPQ